MRPGADVAGEISRLPGGVAFNIAKTVAQFGLRPILLSAVGQDRAGDELLDQCTDMGLVTDHVYRDPNHPTDRYMAIEGANGVVAAIADTRTLEAAGDAILTPLQDGTFAARGDSFEGLVALDGNLSKPFLKQVAKGPTLAKADLRIAPASPGKATRLAPFVEAGRGVLYVNCEEAGSLCNTKFSTSEIAAKTLVARGANRAIVTHGAADATDATVKGVITAQPPSIKAVRFTGAGDTFMAAHISAEIDGADPLTALTSALTAAAVFVSGTPR